MRGRLGSDIRERQAMLVLENDVGRNLAIDDLLENSHGEPSLT